MGGRLSRSSRRNFTETEAIVSSNVVTFIELDTDAAQELVLSSVSDLNQTVELLMPKRKKRDLIRKRKGTLCCIICMECKVSCVCIPCGHAKICLRCLQSMKSRTQQLKCAICRSEVKQVWRLYT